jgi:hypothetical protein
MNRGDISIIVAIVIALAVAGFFLGSNMCPDCVLDCKSCPENVKDVEVNKYKFICFNGSIVDFKEECFTQEGIPQYNPIVTNEGGNFIKSIEIRPTCVSGYKGGNIQYILTTVPTNVTAEIKHADGEFEDFFTTSGAFTDFIDFVICPKRKCFKGDFELQPDTAYLLRLRFEARENAGGTVYSNEYIIDTTEVSPYRQGECAKAMYYS